MFERLEVGDRVKFQDKDGGWLYGVIERRNEVAAIVQWDDGKNTQIYLSKLIKAVAP